MNGFVEDARKPAPRMASLLHRLAHPDRYNGNTDPEYRAAVDACLAAFAPEAEQLVEVEHLGPGRIAA